MTASTAPPRIYLDNAATSWPKPESVYRAVENYQRHLGAPASRSGYAEALEVTQAIAAARRAVAQLVGLADPTNLIFTANGTDSLNLAIHGMLRPGDHVITSVIEHNSILRPLSTLVAAGAIEVTTVPADSVGVIDPGDVAKALRTSTRLMALSHVSNVTGAVQPIADVSRIANAAGVLVLCDAAQSVGHLPVDMRLLGVDLLAASGHKGLLGPLGTGILAIRPGVADQLRSIRQGGTGTQSHDPHQPLELPAKYESGNLNVPGILGLGAGATYLAEMGLPAVEEHGVRLVSQLIAGLRTIPGVRIVGSEQAAHRAPLVSIVIEGYDPQEVALSLDAAYRIQVRPGLHCAPAMHQALGTATGGGTVRFSLGVFNTADEIETTIQAVAELAAAGIAG